MNLWIILLCIVIIYCQYSDVMVIRIVHYMDDSVEFSNLWLESTVKYQKILFGFKFLDCVELFIENVIAYLLTKRL